MVSSHVWIGVAMTVLIVAVLGAYTVSKDKMFSRAAPYMNATDAWMLAFYSHIRARNGDGTNDPFNPPNRGNDSLPTTVIVMLVSTILQVVIVAYTFAKKAIGARASEANPAKDRVYVQRPATGAREGGWRQWTA